MVRGVGKLTSEERLVRFVDYKLEKKNKGKPNRNVHVY